MNDPKEPEYLIRGKTREEFSVDAAKDIDEGIDLLGQDFVTRLANGHYPRTPMVRHLLKALELESLRVGATMDQAAAIRSYWVCGGGEPTPALTLGELFGLRLGGLQ